MSGGRFQLYPLVFAVVVGLGGGVAFGAYKLRDALQVRNDIFVRDAKPLCMFGHLKNVEPHRQKGHY